jgi:hypothetical protein
MGFELQLDLIGICITIFARASEKAFVWIYLAQFDTAAIFLPLLSKGGGRWFHTQFPSPQPSPRLGGAREKKNETCRPVLPLDSQRSSLNYQPSTINEPWARFITATTSTSSGVTSRMNQG